MAARRIASPQPGIRAAGAWTLPPHGVLRRQRDLPLPRPLVRRAAVRARRRPRRRLAAHHVGGGRSSRSGAGPGGRSSRSTAAASADCRVGRGLRGDERLLLRRDRSPAARRPWLRSSSSARSCSRCSARVSRRNIAARRGAVRRRLSAHTRALGRRAGRRRVRLRQRRPSSPSTSCSRTVSPAARRWAASTGSPRRCWCVRRRLADRLVGAAPRLRRPGRARRRRRRRRLVLGHSLRVRPARDGAPAARDVRAAGRAAARDGGRDRRRSSWRSFPRPSTRRGSRSSWPRLQSIVRKTCRRDRIDSRPAVARPARRRPRDASLDALSPRGRGMRRGPDARRSDGGRARRSASTIRSRSASAPARRSRSGRRSAPAAFDRRIARFLSSRPRGTVVALGEGLETQAWRVDNGQHAVARRSTCPRTVELDGGFLPAARVSGWSARPSSTTLARPGRRRGGRPRHRTGAPHVPATSRGAWFFERIGHRFPDGTLVFDAVPRWLVERSRDGAVETGSGYRPPPWSWGLDGREERRLRAIRAFVSSVRCRASAAAGRCTGSCFRPRAASRRFDG